MIGICRILLAGFLFLQLTACSENEGMAENKSFDGDSLYADVQHYVDLGIHRTGTPGDSATAEWLSQRLKYYGFEVKELEFPLRQFFPGRSWLSSGKDSLEGFPLWWVNENIDRHVRGKLVEVLPTTKYSGAELALISFPLKGSGSGDKWRNYLDSLSELGIKGIVIITSNLSGEAQPYNSSLKPDPWKVPVLLVAPKDSLTIRKFLSSEENVNLAINGTFRDVKGKNVYGTIGSGEEQIVVSTPISGWFTCGGERGTGLAIWLGLAKWASTHSTKYSFVFTGNSGHEQAFRGAHEFLERNAPPPSKTHLWFHLGAGAATLKYETTPAGLRKSDVVDSARRFFYSETVRPSFEKAFSELPAEKILSTDKPGGEHLYVARKGYTRFAGVSYAHPYFHVKTDDASTTSPEILKSTATAIGNFIEEETR